MTGRCTGAAVRLGTCTYTWTCTTRGVETIVRIPRSVPVHLNFPVHVRVPRKRQRPAPVHVSRTRRLARSVKSVLLRLDLTSFQRRPIAQLDNPHQFDLLPRRLLDYGSLTRRRKLRQFETI